LNPNDPQPASHLSHPLTWHDGVMSGQNRSPLAAGLRLLATAVSLPYTAVINTRNIAYDAGLKRAHRVRPAVISVGNITTGGTGKTPTVIHITRLLREAGHTPAVLLRGYKAAVGEDSDEQRELRDALGDTPVIADPDRVAAARRIDEQIPEVDVIVLDDGFQHRRLARDLDIVLLDATEPFGHKRVLPRGLLREPLSALRRAHFAVLTHAERADIDATRREILLSADITPLAITRHTWSGALDADDQPVSAERLASTPLFPVCGIGNPAAFLAMARQVGEVVGYRVFADHHEYDAQDLEQLTEQAAAAGAGAIVTTQKDWVKLQSLVESDPGANPGANSSTQIPVWRAQLALGFDEGADALRERVLQAVKDKAQRCKT
jgi:tetraacyldisaccharide 4'-kinase